MTVERGELFIPHSQLDIFKPDAERILDLVRHFEDHPLLHNILGKIPCDQMASTSNDANTFSMISENAVTSTQTFEGISSSQEHFDRHIVRAAELLARDSSTEVVEMNKLAQKSTSVIRYVSRKNTIFV
jgi:hypothetical protein